MISFCDIFGSSQHLFYNQTKTMLDTVKKSIICHDSQTENILKANVDFAAIIELWVLINATKNTNTGLRLMDSFVHFCGGLTLFALFHT